jgi:hypothetical protein
MNRALLEPECNPYAESNDQLENIGQATKPNIVEPIQNAS